MFLFESIQRFANWSKYIVSNMDVGDSILSIKSSQGALSRW